jgi:hypothetical protein
MSEKSKAIFDPLTNTSAFEAFVLACNNLCDNTLMIPKMTTIQSPFFFGGTGFK